MSIFDEIRKKYPFLEIDLPERAQSRLSNQYQESEKFVGEVRLLGDQTTDLQQAVFELLAYRWFETAEGKHLDIIGDWVGQPRTSIDPPFFFGFDGNPQALGFGAARLRGQGENLLGSRIMEDPEYKIAIKSKIFANNTFSTAPEFLNYIFFVFGRRPWIVNERAEVRIYFFEELTTNEILLLNYSYLDLYGQERDFFPHTLGVHRKLFFQTDGNPPFGFEGNPQTAGFGVGQFVEEIAVTS